ncbi:glycosyltransferase family 4 protein [Parasulfuritortus cantonensis]|nr:glycosyltransferase family 4 protein [Parasulfuritortus cantonensis]
MTEQYKYRYFYFKNGDVAAQVERVLALNGKKPTGGPDAFIADFLEKGQVSAVTVAAFLDQDQTVEHGTMRARTYCNVGLWHRLKTLIRYPKEILAAKPERILCGRQGYALAICLIAGKVLHAPVVFSAHNRLSGQAAGIKGRIRNGLDAWLIRRCDAAICHGPYLAQELADIGLPPDRITVFDSGCADLCPDGGFQDVQPPLPPRILFLGRMVREKGIFDLLEAFHCLIKDGMTAQLVYAGDGTDRLILAKKVQEFGLQAHVQLLGPIPHGDIGALIQSAWAMVTPTRSEFPEGRCMSAMEALAIGTPVIAPNDGPFPYLINSGVNGILYKQNSLPELTKALAAIISTNELRTELSVNCWESRYFLLRPEKTFGEAVMSALNRSTLREDIVTTLRN